MVQRCYHTRRRAEIAIHGIDMLHAVASFFVRIQICLTPSENGLLGITNIKNRIGHQIAEDFKLLLIGILEFVYEKGFVLVCQYALNAAGFDGQPYLVNQVCISQDVFSCFQTPHISYSPILQPQVQVFQIIQPKLLQRFCQLYIFTK